MFYATWSRQSKFRKVHVVSTFNLEQGARWDGDSNFAFELLTVSVFRMLHHVHRLERLFLLLLEKFCGEETYRAVHLTLYAPCIILQCLEEPKRCTILTDNLYFTVFTCCTFSDILSVYHQEHCLVNCITQLVHSCRRV